MADNKEDVFEEFAEGFARSSAKASEEFEKQKAEPPKYDIKPMKEGTGGFIQPDDDGIRP